MIRNDNYNQLINYRFRIKRLSNLDVLISNKRSKFRMMAFIAEQLLCRKNVEQYPTAQNALYIKQNKINIAGLAI